MIHFGNPGKPSEYKNTVGRFTDLLLHRDSLLTIIQDAVVKSLYLFYNVIRFDGDHVHIMIICILIGRVRDEALTSVNKQCATLLRKYSF